MPEPQVQRFEVVDPVHGRVPCAAVTPASDAPRATCLFLYGGGGSRETLVEIAPLLHAWWQGARLPPMAIVTPDVGPWSFYLDDPARGMGWETFVAERLIASCGARPIGAVGISMGGYGALKIAFARPRLFAAVAAVSPMIEPAVEAHQVPLRNRYHYPAEVPQALLGPERDAELYRRDHPAARARANAAALRASELAIYLDAAGADALHAQDGAEHLHRALWDLDVAHEYRLRRDADHVGPDLIDRLADAFAWAGDRLVPRPSTAPDPDPRAQLRAHLEPLRRAAEPLDPTFARRYGVLR
jgi:S-formylglutathione hydrolase